MIKTARVDLGRTLPGSLRQGFPCLGVTAGLPSPVVNLKILREQPVCSLSPEGPRKITLSDYLTSDQLSKLEKVGQVMTIYDFVGAHLEEARHGYALGISGDKANGRTDFHIWDLYQHFLSTYWLYPWKAFSGNESFYAPIATPANTNSAPEYIRPWVQIAIKQKKALVFFIPKDILTHQEANMTKNELLEFMKFGKWWRRPWGYDKQKVFFVVGVYELLSREDYDKYFSRQLGMDFEIEWPRWQRLLLEFTLPQSES